MGFGVGLDEGNFLIPKQAGWVGVLCVVMMISGSEQRLIPNTRVLCTAQISVLASCVLFRGLGLVLRRVKLVLEVKPARRTIMALWFSSSSVFGWIFL